MQTRTLAFFKRAIRQDSRLISHHMLRAAMSAVILFMFAIELQTFALRTGGGGKLVGTVLSCGYWFLTLLGGVHFSTAITEEKEERTLPLLRMTGAGPITILVGKSVPRLLTTLLFLTVVAPFVILSITLGGVLPEGILGAILNLILYGVMFSQIGLFASIVCRTSRSAFSLTAFLWALIELSHWWYGALNAWVQYGRIRGTLSQDSLAFRLVEGPLARLPELSVWANLNLILSPYTGTGGSGDLSWWAWLQQTLPELLHFRMLFHLVIAAAMFGLSWLLFERFADRGPGTERRTGIGVRLTRKFSRSRAWKNAVAWKSWRFIAGGWPWFWVRLVGTPLLVVAGSIGVLMAFDNNIEYEVIAAICLFVGFPLGLVNLARLFGRLIPEEMQQQTLSVLIMLPRPAERTFRSMLLGVIPSAIAGFSCVVLGYLLLLYRYAVQSRANLEDMTEMFLHPWFWQLITLATLTVALGMLLTTYIRYGGMILAVILLWFLGPMLLGMVFSVFAMAIGRVGFELFTYVIPLLLIAGEVVLSVFIYRKLVARMEELAAR